MRTGTSFREHQEVETTTARTYQLQQRATNAIVASNTTSKAQPTKPDERTSYKSNTKIRVAQASN